MAACEKCWADAGMIAMLTNGSIAWEYERLSQERKDHPCSPEQQCGDLHVADANGNCRCGKISRAIKA